MRKKFLCHPRFLFRTNFNVVLLIILTILSLSYKPSALAQTNSQAAVPVLIGENKNAHGDQQPLPPFIQHLLTQLENELGQPFMVERYPWIRAIRLAETENRLIFGFSITPERAKQFRFSEPLYYNNIWLVTRSDNTFPYKTIQDLKGKSIGVLRGSNYGGEFDQQKNKLFRVEDDIDAYPARLRKLLMRRMDAMLFASAESHASVVEAQVNKIMIDDANGGAVNPHLFSVLPVPVLRDGVRFAINKNDNSDIISRLNSAIEKIRKSGTLNKIVATPGFP